MLTKLNDPYFMDISEIDYKQANIEFSVDEMLQGEYFCKKNGKATQKSHKSKELGSSHPYKQTGQKSSHNSKAKEIGKTRKNTIGVALEMNKNSQPIEERQTQDHSQTVKKGAVYPTKALASPKNNQHSTLAVLLSPNKKSQPKQFRSKSRSNVSLRPISARPSVISKKAEGAPLKSYLSPRPSTNRNSRSRCNTQEGKIEAIRKEHAEMIRHDYFDDQATEPRPANKHKHRSGKSKAGLGKKTENGKRSKKSLHSVEKMGLKSPRLGHK